VPVKRIARWDGHNWTALGNGIVDPDGGVNELQVHDDGSGPQLYVGGGFKMSKGAPGNDLARWNGTTWSAVGSYAGPVSAMGIFDDGSGAGPKLFVGGNFVQIAGSSALRVASWDGSSWSALGPGLPSAPGGFLGFDDGQGLGPALFIGGSFTVPQTGDSCFAKWGCPGATPWTDLGSGLAGTHGIPALNGHGQLVAGSWGEVMLTSALEVVPCALFVSLTSSPAPFKGGVLVPVPVALTFDAITSPKGTLPLVWPAWPPGIPSGSTLYFQAAIQDAAAPKGVALSNALQATTP